MADKLLTRINIYALEHALNLPDAKAMREALGEALAAMALKGSTDEQMEVISAMHIVALKEEAMALNIIQVQDPEERLRAANGESPLGKRGKPITLPLARVSDHDILTEAERRKRERGPIQIEEAERPE